MKWDQHKNLSYKFESNYCKLASRSFKLKVIVLLRFHIKLKPKILI